MWRCRSKTSLIATLTLGCVVVSTALGEVEHDRVDVSAVHFRIIAPPNGAPDSWYEMEIELSVQPAPQRPGQVTPRIRVEAMVACDVPGLRGERRWEFYRAAAEVVGLAAGRTAVRFYLPPIIVKRDRLGDAPQYWEVRLSGKGLAEKTGDRVSTALKDEQVRRAFHDQLAATAAANDGILQPQYLTPFATAYPRSTPDFVRREVWP